MTEHYLSSIFRPVEIVESGWSIQQVAGVQKRRSRQHEYRGGVAILTRDEAGLHVEQTRVIDGSGPQHPLTRQCRGRYRLTTLPTLATSQVCI